MGLFGLVGEQVHGVGSVVPQQVVGPAAGLAQRIGVGAAEEVGLHIHLLDVELARRDLLVHILVAGVEAAGVAAHGHQPGLLLQGHHGFSALEGIRQGNFHLHMLARLQAGNRLLGVHLRGGAQDDGVHFLQGQAVGQIGGDMADAVFVSDFLGLLQIAADQGHHFHTVDVLDAVQVFDAEGTGASQCNFDGFAHIRHSPESDGPPPCCWRVHGKNGA